MSKPSFNSSTKNALLSFTKSAIELDPAIAVAEKDTNLVFMTREFRTQATLQSRIEPMLEKRRIPQTLKQITANLDRLENNRSTQAAHQSLSPRALDLSARVSERTEQHGRLVEDTHKLINKTKHFFRNVAKTLWSKDAKQASASFAQQPETLDIKKEMKELQTRRDDLAKNLPELAMRLKTLNNDINSIAATVPALSDTAPRPQD